MLNLGHGLVAENGCDRLLRLRGQRQLRKRAPRHLAHRSGRGPGVRVSLCTFAYLLLLLHRRHRRHGTGSGSGRRSGREPARAVVCPLLWGRSAPSPALSAPAIVGVVVIKGIVVRRSAIAAVSTAAPSAPATTSTSPLGLSPSTRTPAVTTATYSNEKSRYQKASETKKSTRRNKCEVGARGSEADICTCVSVW